MTTRRRHPQSRRSSRRLAVDSKKHAPAPAPAPVQEVPSAARGAAEWVLFLDGAETAALTVHQVKDLVDAGRVTADTPIRKADMEKFVRAAKVKGLLPASAAGASPTPPRPAARTNGAAAPTAPLNDPPRRPKPRAPVEETAVSAAPPAVVTENVIDDWDAADTEELPDIRSA